MREPATWIKLNRNILEWRWHQDPNTLSVFIHLLVKANIETKQFRNIEVKRGDVIISQDELAELTGLTRQKVRRSLQCLISTKSITTSRHGKIVVISIPNYDKYQRGQPNNQPSKNHKTTTTKEYKNINNILSPPYNPPTGKKSKPYHVPSLDEVREYERISSKGKDPDAFFRHYSSLSWKTANGQRVYDWQRLYDVWELPEQPAYEKISPCTDAEGRQNEKISTFTDADGYTYELRNGRYECVGRKREK